MYYSGDIEYLGWFFVGVGIFMGRCDGLYGGGKVLGGFVGYAIGGWGGRVKGTSGGAVCWGGGVVLNMW